VDCCDLVDAPFFRNVVLGKTEREEVMKTIVVGKEQGHNALVT